MADAFEWGSSLTVKLDTSNTTAALTDITDYVNSYSIRTAFDVFRVEGLNSDDPERQHGMADVSVPLNGWVNTTTEAIFGPLVGNRASVMKTFALGMGVAKNSTSDWWYTGEFSMTDVEYSGDPTSLQTWSCTLAQSGAFSRTSVEPT